MHFYHRLLVSIDVFATIDNTQLTLISSYHYSQSFMAKHSHISYGNDASLRNFYGIFSDKSCLIRLNEGFWESQPARGLIFSKCV